MTFLITGGAGYIGSITNWFFRRNGHKTVVFDNLQNSHKEAVGDTELIIGDLQNQNETDAVFKNHSFDAVIHFAALALAGESMQKPYDYLQNNILGVLHLLESMRNHQCRRIIFSSTCAVYGFPQKLPVTEESSISPVSVYGESKYIVEKILSWYDKIYGIKSGILRYFNACGALPDGSLGEAHKPETHIIPIALSVAAGKKPKFELYGNDYNTPDKTCIRDYIHVLDLADAHEKAVKILRETNISFCVNVGVGRGYSNKEILKAVENVTGKTIPVVYKPRRWGDPDSIYTDNSKAQKYLGWHPTYTTIESIIKTAWAWHKTHS